MIINFLENPQKKIINIYFDKKHILNKKYVNGNISYFKIEKKFKIINKNIIFSFNKISEINKFFQTFKASRFIKTNVYFVCDISKSRIFNKFFTFLSLIFIKKKEIIILNKNYQNSLTPDFLYKIRFNSKVKSYVYFFYQLFKNYFSIFNTNLILIKFI